ncbi:MFS transporter [Novosphingobium sp. SG707]|uniref:MFS transporter n=1 Tax=Novosphingobium sp. SG707 TaxID=2586996 RepID=UPI0014474038|nr:MFS transporter [Novosphingobium sp. SG707]NKJ01791.1 DHA1 family bicyclomycin/chloramphenicol resistance-like MFS transporter [Novosphingobium sp. SG707]
MNGTMLALAMVAALGSMAIHMLVPALPQLASDFATNAHGAQLAISIYMIGLGAAQLVAGPAVDRLGRRPILLCGLALYGLGALGCALAGSLPMLLAARAVQAAGGAAGVVTARVMVGDLFGRDEAAARQATLMTIVLISPALAPVLGGFLTAVGGWRTIPMVLALVALGVLALVGPRLPHGARAVSAAKAAPDMRRLLGNARFTLSTLAMASASSTLYMFLASAPFLLRDEGLDPRQIGIALLVVAAASIGGTRMVRHVSRGGYGLAIGTGLIFVGACGAGLLAGMGLHSPAALFGPIVLVGLGAGVAGPSAMAIIVFAEESMAGTATSIAGATQMLASAGATLALGLIAPMSSWRLALAMLTTAAVCAGAGWCGSRAAKAYETEQS